MQNNIKNVNAIVMGHTETALSIARALGRRGLNVIGVGPTRNPPTFSRFMKFVREPSTESENVRLNFFINLGKKLKSRSVILPTLDPNVLFLSRNREVLEQYFMFILPPHDLLESIISKSKLIDFAKRYKIDLPHSIPINNKSDLKNIPIDFYPCVLKPDSQHSFLTQKAARIGLWGIKAIPAKNKFELSLQYDRVRELEPNVTIQKMVLGPDENHLCYHAFIDYNNRTLGEFVGRKLRLTPPHFGMGCYVESIKSDHVINEGRRILRILNYRGMAEIDFKQDERDGRLYFFELNPRFGFWMGLDVACGVDFPYYYYKTCLGEQIVVDNNYLTGKRWLSLYHDIKGLRVNIKNGSLTWQKWIWSVVKNDVGAIFALDDSMPAIMLIQEILKNQIIKIVNRIRV